MFHLNLIKMLLREHLTKIMLVFGVMIALSYGLGNQNLLKKQLGNKFGVGEQAEGPFFYAIIQNVNVANNARLKLLELPGIDRVTIITPDTLNKKIDSFFSNVSNDPELKNKMNEMVKDQIGIKILFIHDVDDRSTALITSYLKRLTEGTETSIGPIVDKRKQMLASPWLNPLLTNLDLALFILCLPIIAIALSALSNQFRNTLYIYNRYQRTKVNHYIFSLLVAFVLSSPLYLVPLINSINITRTLLICVAIFILMFIQLARNPNWRLR
jgi:hypothetical protein